MIVPVQKNLTLPHARNPTKNQTKIQREYFQQRDNTSNFNRSFYSPSLQETAFECLNGKTIFEAKISDHLPLIHHGMLFWNVMMQCRFNEKGGYYNNGFGIIESDSLYEQRLSKIAQVIAEMAQKRTDIDRIGICEGPIGDNEKLFYTFLRSHISLANFTTQSNGFAHLHTNSDQNGPKWGVLLLTHEKYSVENIPISPQPYAVLSNLETKLENRFGIFKLTISNCKEVKLL